MRQIWLACTVRQSPMINTARGWLIPTEPTVFPRAARKKSFPVSEGPPLPKKDPWLWKTSVTQNGKVEHWLSKVSLVFSSSHCLGGWDKGFSFVLRFETTHIYSPQTVHMPNLKYFVNSLLVKIIIFRIAVKTIPRFSAHLIIRCVIHPPYQSCEFLKEKCDEYDACPKGQYWFTGEKMK